MQCGMDESNNPTPRKTRQRSWIDRSASLLSTIAFIAFVYWIVNGAAGGGKFLWWVVALFLAPIVLYLLFIAAIGLSFIREGKRNMREASLRNERNPPDAPDPHVKRSPPSRRKPRKR
jgi:hypothetical protein